MKNRLAVIVVFFLVAAAYFGYHYINTRNLAVLDKRWAASDETSDTTLDHSDWQTLLDDYLITDDESGVNLFDYEGLDDDGDEQLQVYLSAMQAVDPLQLNRAEQKSYWINLYNALTVDVILDNYPVQSITTLGETTTSFGPWDDNVATVNNIELSLNDIEHRIIRPVFQDYRIHFAVNCASIGCPDLNATAYTADNMDELLDQAAGAYLAHPRGLRISNGTVHLSSLFDWYQTDFGADLPETLQTLSAHLDETTAQQLRATSGKPVYAYDWSLNGACHATSSCAPVDAN